MSLSLYMDVHVPGPITRGLRQRKVVVLTAQEDGADRLSDAELLDRAMAHGYILVTQDTDLLVEAAHRQRSGGIFAGLIFARQQANAIGRYIDDLELLAKVYDPPEFMNHVEYLPL